MKRIENRQRITNEREKRRRCEKHHICIYFLEFGYVRALVHACACIYNFSFTFSASRLHFDYSTTNERHETIEKILPRVCIRCVYVISSVFFWFTFYSLFPALCAARFNINCTCVYQMQRHIQHVHNTTRFTKSKRQQIGTDNGRRMETEDEHEN